MKLPQPLLTTFVITGLSILLMAAPISQAQALEIVITQDGTIEFYQDEVLGRNIAQGRDNPAANNRPDLRPSRQIAPREKMRLRLNNINDQARVGIEQKSNATDQAEILETNQLRLRAPANLKSTTEVEGNQQQNRNPRVDQQPQVRQLEEPNQATSRAREINQEQQQYIEQVRQERRSRINEEIEIFRQEQQSQADEFRLRSREAEARLQNGAEFVIDPETNSVSLTTPSGITHELNHLPDQAIEQMIAAGVITEQSQVEDLEITTVEDEEDEGVAYQATVQQQKRLLGLFARTIPARVQVNDATGEVEVEQIESISFFEQLLNRLSF